MSRTLLIAVVLCLGTDAMCSESVVEKAVSLPVAYDVDVVVAGGSHAGVEAACTAAARGARVFLLDGRPYLGYDLCATQRLWLEPGESPKTALTRRIFGDRRTATPNQVKSCLDRALIDAGVPFLTGCFATDVLVGPDGSPAGVVMVNRSGRQVVRAKVIIDATRDAALARTAGAKFKVFRPGPKRFGYVVVGGKPTQVPHRKLDVTFDWKDKRYPVYEYALELQMSDGGFRSLIGALNEARSLTYTDGAVDLGECLINAPEDVIEAEGTLPGPWPGADAVGLQPFRPAGVGALYVLGPYAGLSPEQAARAMMASESPVIGRRIGEAAAAEAKERVRQEKIDFPRKGLRTGAIEIRDGPASSRFREKPFAELSPRELPVLAEVDVVVVGGGTSGAPAAIGAARSGARTLVLEYLDELGGVSTAGLIGAYWYGYRRGFTAEIDRRFGERWNVVNRAEWLRREVLKAGGEVWFESFGCGAMVAAGKVVGVVVATPHGRGVVLARCVIDSTGNADIAAAAGAETEFSISSLGELSVQVAGYPMRNPGDSYNNTSYTLVDDTDVLDLWHLMLCARQEMYAGSYDAGQLVGSRERRRMVGDYQLKTTDILTSRTYPDTICHMRSNFDSARFPDSEMFFVKDMIGPVYACDFPFRCLLPKGLDGILVTGLGASVERDAMALTRMQPDLQSQGYAAGIAAAMAVKTGGSTRGIDVKALQSVLVQNGTAERRVLTDTDSYPLQPQRLSEAVKILKDLKMEIDQDNRKDDPTYSALAAVLSHPRESVPLLRAAHAAATGTAEKTNYARILAVLQDDSGVETLIQTVSGAPGWGEGYGLTAHRKFNTFSEVDRLVIALGFMRSPKAIPALIEKLEQLDAADRLSHFKAICLALRLNKDAALAEPLARLLGKPGISGYAQDAGYSADAEGGAGALQIPKRAQTGGDVTKNLLNAKFRELLVAALLYQCGDKDGKGRAVLEAYSRDVHGHFAAYARAVLDGEIQAK